MRSTFLVFLFFVSIPTWSQSPIEQMLYENKIWKVVKQINGEVNYYDSSDVFIGGKRTNKNSVFYYDHRKRTIKILNTNQVKSIPVKKAKKNNFKPDYSFVKHGDYFVKTKRNKTQYFDEQGNLIRTIRKKGNTIYYKNSKGELIGYKKLGKNGFVEYRDAKGRKTGTSYLNSAGILVYNKYKRRNTLAFMISDVYFF